MSKSVSTDALWEKLSEIEEKINKCLQEQKTSVPAQEQIDISPELKANKDEIIEIFKKCIQGLGTHFDSHFKAIYKTLGEIDGNMDKTSFSMFHIWAGIQIMEEREQEKAKQDSSYLNFKFFKIRKTSIVINLLALLVFVLTTFCMKQQNDYSILNGEYYRNRIEIREVQAEVDSLRNIAQPSVVKKK